MKKIVVLLLALACIYMAGVVTVVGKTYSGEVVTVLNPGDYTEYSVQSPCGLCTEYNVIGKDDPSVFSNPEHTEAELVWFTSGYLVYRFNGSDNASELIISCEISSEAPGSNIDYPSDISFSINNVEIGTYTVPGDPGYPHGNLTPDWWPNGYSQWGWLVTWEVTEEGTFVNGDKVSNVTIDDLGISSVNTLKISAGTHGINIYGDKFGNYPQDIVITVKERLILTCDANGNSKDSFAPGECVYVKGLSLEPNTQYTIWIQPDPVNAGDTLNPSTDPSEVQEVVTTDSNGNFDPIAVWCIPSNAMATYQKWDIIADVNGNGVFDSGDVIDSATTYGLIAPIPEIATLILAAVGLMLVYGRIK